MTDGYYWRMGSGTSEMASVCTSCEQSMQDKKLSCGHVFHVSCIDEWLRDKGTCPICRSSFNSATTATSKETKECPICLDYIVRVSTLPCGHGFHASCLRGKSRCPQCSAPCQELVLSRCLLCSEDLLLDEDKLSCGHAFHESCVSSWKKERNCCPECSTTIDRNRVSLPPENCSICLQKIVTKVKILLCNHKSHETCSVEGGIEMCPECLSLSTSLEEAQLAPSCLFCDQRISADSLTLPCGHKFHERCSASWLKENKVCPDCLTVYVPPEEPVPSARALPVQPSLVPPPIPPRSTKPISSSPGTPTTCSPVLNFSPGRSLTASNILTIPHYYNYSNIPGPLDHQQVTNSTTSSTGIQPNTLLPQEVNLNLQQGRNTIAGTQANTVVPQEVNLNLQQGRNTIAGTQANTVVPQEVNLNRQQGRNTIAGTQANTVVPQEVNLNLQQGRYTIAGTQANTVVPQEVNLNLQQGRNTIAGTQANTVVPQEVNLNLLQGRNTIAGTQANTVVPQEVNLNRQQGRNTIAGTQANTVVPQEVNLSYQQGSVGIQAGTQNSHQDLNPVMRLPSNFAQHRRNLLTEHSSDTTSPPYRRRPLLQFPPATLQQPFPNRAMARSYYQGRPVEYASSPNHSMGMPCHPGVEPPRGHLSPSGASVSSPPRSPHETPDSSNVAQDLQNTLKISKQFLDKHTVASSIQDVLQKIKDENDRPSRRPRTVNNPANRPGPRSRSVKRNTQKLSLGKMSASNLSIYDDGREELDTRPQRFDNHSNNNLSRNKQNLSGNRKPQRSPAACSFCSNNITGKKVKLGCGHQFHEMCTLPWLKDNKSCCVCGESCHSDDDDENEALRREIEELKMKDKLREKRLEQIEEVHRKKNLIFKGIRSYGPDSYRQVICHFCAEVLCIDVEDLLEAVVPVGRKRVDHPTLKVVFNSSQSATEVLSKCRRLKGTEFSVSRDYSQTVRARRNKLLHCRYEIIKKTNLKSVSVRDEVLLIDNRKFVWDDEDGLVAKEDKADEEFLRNLVGDETWMHLKTFTA